MGLEALPTAVYQEGWGDLLVQGLGCGSFPKIRGVPYVGGPYNKGPTI